MTLFVLGALLGFLVAVGIGLIVNARKSDEEVPAFCIHPQSAVKNLSTFGLPRYRCGACGAESAQPFPTTLEA